MPKRTHRKSFWQTLAFAKKPCWVIQRGPMPNSEIWLDGHDIKRGESARHLFGKRERLPKNLVGLYNEAKRLIAKPRLDGHDVKRGIILFGNDASLPKIPVRL